MAILFLESGTDATQGLEFFSSVGGNVSSSLTNARTGPRSIRFEWSGSDNIVLSNILGSPTARRISFAYYPAAAQATQWNLWSIAGAALSLKLVWTTSDTLELQNATSGVLATSSVGLNVGDWNSIQIAYTWTSASDNGIRIWVNGVLEINASNLGGWTVQPDGQTVFYGSMPASGNYSYIDDIYIDSDGAALTNPGDIRVTAKLPASDNTVNFDTTVGTGAVNERPLSVTNGQQHAAATDVQENYTLQNAATGDEDLTGATLIGHTGWVYGKRGDFETKFVGPNLTGTIQDKTSSHTTTVIPVTQASQTGNFISVSFSCNDDGNPGTTATCADSKGNTYSSGESIQASDTGNAVGVRTAHFAALNATALTTSDTITITHGSLSASAAIAQEFAGIVTSSALDKTNSAVERSNFSSPTTGATGTLSQANELVIGVIGCEATVNARTTTAVNMRDLYHTAFLVTYAFVGTSGAGASSNISVFMHYAIVNATTSLTGGQTTGPENRDWTSVIASYKAVTGGTSAGDPKIMVNGTEYSVTLTTSNALYTQLVDSASYPSNAAGIGMRSSGTTADTFLYECGVLVAYTPAVSPIPMPLGRRSQYTVRV